MKKLTTTILSLALITNTLSAAGMTVSANYREIDDMGNIGEVVYEEFDAYNDYYEIAWTNGIVLKSVHPINSDVYSFRLKNTSSDGSETFSTVSLNFTSYSDLTEEEAAALEAYLNENYPGVSVSYYSLYNTTTAEDGTKIETATYRLTYNEEFTLEEKLEIGISVDRDLGFAFDQYFLANVVYMLRLGDLDGDSTVNALDASLVLTYYSDSQTGGLDVYSDEEIQDISLLGDYDGDGTVNAIDASLVLKEYAETQTK